ncbi:hypothetical protein [Paracidovorax wautersii]|uniref:Uncharacterized protein n=1 Tax=Paracidovorax wautersii TaxID=1177982 RepID=A0ABU1IIW5_9BURK|nr:hypothetical protein [Paracidovorax wautersii]MDR6216219.1 hypothetical protein [Paracidovorax wautersii]
MSAKHTPGPWSLNTQYADIEVRGPAESGVLIAVMSPWGIAADTESPQAANAHLIAAAPELLEALQGLDEAYCRAGAPLTREERHEDRKRLIAARAAISKATGAAP